MADDARPVFRFAPSPNGDLHLGHAFSALFTAAMARKAGGRFLLRIEDIDADRCRPHFEARVYEDLAWLGLRWEQPVRRQSEHFPAYAAALDRLRRAGLVYPCFATRSEIARAAAQRKPLPTDPDGAPLYPGLFRDAPAAEIESRMQAGEPYALRLDIGKALAAARAKGDDLRWRRFDDDFGVALEEDAPAAWGDVVLGRKDAPASYHLCVALDDALQGVTHVTRGIDLLAATSLHRLLQILLDLPAPAYRHHALILDAEGRKLSKRHGDKGLRALRAEGATPRDIRAMLPALP